MAFQVGTHQSRNKDANSFVRVACLLLALEGGFKRARDLLQQYVRESFREDPVGLPSMLRLRGMWIGERVTQMPCGNGGARISYVPAAAGTHRGARSDAPPAASAVASLASEPLLAAHDGQGPGDDRQFSADDRDDGGVGGRLQPGG